MALWVVGSKPNDRPFELSLAPASALRLVLHTSWYVLSCLWDGAYKRSIAANRKE